MNWDLQNIKTYNGSAEDLAQYFNSIGPRVTDIDLAIKLSGSGKNARVVEIGCGTGRDAEDIINKTKWYEGFDPSQGLLKIATRNLPNTSFIIANALTYKYPDNIDIVFAFASLLHINKNNLLEVFKKVEKSLRKDGIFYISLKESKDYSENIKRDKYGERMFYYYNPSLIKEIAGNSFQSIFEDHQKINATDWFTIALKKI